MNSELMKFVNHCADIGADPDTVKDLLDADPKLKDNYQRFITLSRAASIDTLAGPVYRIPVLTPKACDVVMDYARKCAFKPNLEEGADYQIDEHVIDPKMGVYRYVLNGAQGLLTAYALFVYSREITGIASMQIARYSPDRTYKTGWHHDTESDVTCVVSLNPGEFEGGGTGIRTSPDTLVNVPPLSRGNGLFFNGKTVQHRGLPVTSGERYLLVLWMTTK